MPRRGSNRRNGSSSSSSPNANQSAAQSVAAALKKSAPPPPGLFDPPSLDAKGKPSMAIADFEGFGWSPEKIKAVLEQPELRTDSLAQIPQDVTFEERIKHKKAQYRHFKNTGLKPVPEGYATDDENDDGKGKTKTKGVKRKKQRDENIFITGSDNWVLFDPLKGYGEDKKNEATPKIFTRYERFKPGNRKILCWNLVSAAVTLKTTPAEFEGYDVEYLRTGPKLTKAKTPRAQPTRKTREGKGKEGEAAKEPEMKKEKEKTPPPTRRSPRSKKRSRDAEEAEAAEAEAAPAPKRRKAIPKSKKQATRPVAASSPW
ncbi:hypothetical protein M409DRAFT_20329 [Zasmidium cellare ATCC 36951]|uniref:Uncharacterized protein n=1 Tax=Zasmidium cellare ATCC 36951 TaxID=1080233 RepID=A0A6A6CTJ6_ZASCE|nr:uncharacterized protein M409DRAFT_20329 [Zasmidium cellare ATCC 36951]KAF2169099.1 hypothetical protein M409DRAFT_20329 [Zasmidium cellare ATCC 36951]